MRQCSLPGVTTFIRTKNKNSEIQFSNPTWPVDLFSDRPDLSSQSNFPTRHVVPSIFRLNPSNTGQNAIIHIICEATCIRVSIPNMDTHINIKFANGFFWFAQKHKISDNRISVFIDEFRHYTIQHSTKRRRNILFQLCNAVTQAFLYSIKSSHKHIHFLHIQFR